MKFDTRNSRSSNNGAFHALLLCALMIPSAAFAGNGLGREFNYSTTAGYPGGKSLDGTGTNAFFTKTAGSAVDSAGNIYISDFGNNTIRKISAGGVVTTFAGSPGIAGSANGTGTNALFNGPEGLAVDSGGNVYVADSGNNTIRMMTPGGVVTTLAGLAGVSGSRNSIGTNALFNSPSGLAVDVNSNVYVADYGNHTIRKISPAGVVNTLAGSAGNPGYQNGVGINALFNEPESVAVSAAGTVYVADTANNIIRAITSAGSVSTLAGSGNSGNANGVGTNASFNAPQGVVVDNRFGNLYVADTGNNQIRQIHLQNLVVTTTAGTGIQGSADGVGTSASFWGPVELTMDNGGDVIVPDYFNGTVREITSGGIVTTIAGSASNGEVDGATNNARFSMTQAVAVDGSGNVFVADAANHVIRKITLGVVSTFAGTEGIPGSKDGTGTNAQFNAPQAIAVDGSGNVYVADTLNDTIRVINSIGMVSTLAGTVGYANNTDDVGTNAQFNEPQGIAVDLGGNVYVSDTLNHTIRYITPDGTVSTMAGTPNIYGSDDDSTNATALFNLPKGIAVDSAYNVYVVDSGNNTVRMISNAGITTTIAGMAGSFGSADGTNSGARFFMPDGVAVDNSQNVYVADSGNHLIRKVFPSGTNWLTITIGGQAGNAGSADGLETMASFFFPSSVALDSSLNLYVGDAGNNTIRYGSIEPGTDLSNVAVAARPAGATITWTTLTPSTTQLFYGLTTNYGLVSTYDPALVTNHAVLIYGLTPSNTYYFNAVSTFGIVSGNATGSFSTITPVIIMTSLQASYSGVWVNDSTPEDNYSQTYKYASVAPAAGAASATFRPTIITPAQYDAYIWYPEGANRSQLAPVTVAYDGGATTTTLNETLPGGKWMLLAANETYAAGTNAFVRLSNYTGENNKIVMSDAIMWTYTPGQDAPANGNVPGWWASFYYGTKNINSAQTAANGRSILDDYVLGLSPTDPNASLYFTIAHAPGSGFSAIFSPYFDGRSYQLQVTTNITNPVWRTVPGLSVTQDANGNGVITCPGTNAAPGFYRLSVQLLL